MCALNIEYGICTDRAMAGHLRRWNIFNEHDIHDSDCFENTPFMYLGCQEPRHL